MLETYDIKNALSASVKRSFEKASKEHEHNDKSSSLEKKKKYKPFVKKPLRTFITNLQKLLQQSKNEECKKLSEWAIKEKQYGEIPQDGRLYLYCGESNYNLGYLIIAEQMLNKSITYPEIKNES